MWFVGCNWTLNVIFVWYVPITIGSPFKYNSLFVVFVPSNISIPVLLSICPLLLLPDKSIHTLLLKSIDPPSYHAWIDSPPFKHWCISSVVGWFVGDRVGFMVGFVVGLIVAIY